MTERKIVDLKKFFVLISFLLSFVILTGCEPDWIPEETAKELTTDALNDKYKNFYDTEFEVVSIEKLETHSRSAYAFDEYIVKCKDSDDTEFYVEMTWDGEYIVDDYEVNLYMPELEKIYNNETLNEKIKEISDLNTIAYIDSIPLNLKDPIGSSNAFLDFVRPNDHVYINMETVIEPTLEEFNKYVQFYYNISDFYHIHEATLNGVQITNFTKSWQKHIAEEIGIEGYNPEK